MPKSHIKEKDRKGGSEREEKKLEMKKVASD